MNQNVDTFSGSHTSVFFEGSELGNICIDNNGSVEMTDCSISSSSIAGRCLAKKCLIGVSNSRDISVEKNELIGSTSAYSGESTGVGMIVQKGADISVEHSILGGGSSMIGVLIKQGQRNCVLKNCEISNCALDGIVIEHDSCPQISDCVISSSGRCGIRFCEGSDNFQSKEIQNAKIVNCEIKSNHLAGILIADISCNPSISACTVSSTQMLSWNFCVDGISKCIPIGAGIVCMGNGRGNVSNCFFEHNIHGIACWAGATTCFSDNTCRGNTEHGVFVLYGAACTFERDCFCNNERAMIALCGSGSRCLFRNCKIFMQNVTYEEDHEKMAAVGVWAYDGGSSVLEACKFTGLYMKHCLLTETAAEPVLQACELMCEGMLHAAVRGDRSGEGTLDRTSIMHAYIGVELSDGSDVHLVGCNILDSKHQGVLFRDKSRGLLMSCTIVRAVGAGVQVQSHAMPHVERCSVCETRLAPFCSVVPNAASNLNFLVSFGLFLLGQSSCTIFHCTFRENSTTGICSTGGGLDMSLSPASVENCHFFGPCCCGVLALPHSRMSITGCCMRDCSIGCILMPFSSINLQSNEFFNCCRGGLIVMNPNTSVVSNCRVENPDRGLGFACFQTQMDSFSELLLSLAIVTDLILLLPFHKMDAVFKNEQALTATLPIRLVEALESEMMNGHEVPLPESVIFNIIRAMSSSSYVGSDSPDASFAPQFSNNQVSCSGAPAFVGMVSNTFAGTFLVVAKTGRHLLQQENGIFGILTGDFLAYECDSIESIHDVSLCQFIFNLKSIVLTFSTTRIQTADLEFVPLHLSCLGTNHGTIFRALHA
jgi:parallel beta-helix repeat protein